MKILLDEKQNKYKANLHCHSTVSDGKCSPEELKKIYTEKGYSIIAYTDHNVMIAHDELNDDNFLALHGYETDVTECGEKFNTLKTCHLCFIQKDPNNMQQACWHREWYVWGNAENYRSQVQFDKSLPDFVREYTPECINKMIETGRKNGFFVTYNHPNWSMEDASVYTKYSGMNAMEICNYGCVEAGFDDYSPEAYDSLLRNGEKIYCIAADDNHNNRLDSFGGFTVIFADKLNYKIITDALSNGKFYASQGPEITSLTYDDNKISIKCSEAERIILSTAFRRRSILYAENDVALTEGIFDVFDDDGYIRITIEDKYGKHANTNAYFIEDLKK